jgi:hypothetical protein
MHKLWKALEDRFGVVVRRRPERKRLRDLRIRLPVTYVQVRYIQRSPRESPTPSDLRVWCPRQDSSLRHRLRSAKEGRF